MSDDATLRHVLTVTITATTEAIFTEVAPMRGEPAAAVAAAWVGRWCRGSCRRASIDALSWPAHTVQMNIHLNEDTHTHLVRLARERQRDLAEVASAIINGTAADLMTVKHRGFIVD